MSPIGLSPGIILFGSEDAKISAGIWEPYGLLSLKCSCNLLCPPGQPGLPLPASFGERSSCGPFLILTLPVPCRRPWAF